MDSSEFNGISGSPVRHRNVSQHSTNLATHTHKSVRVPTGLAIFTMILCCLLAHEAVGQKEWKDPYISIAQGHQQKPSVAQPSRAGDVVTVWEDERHHATLGSDIYIQEFDAGTGIPRWIGPRAYVPGMGHLDVVTNRFDGIVVCNAPGDQRNPRAAYDGMDGVIIVWEDYRDDPTNTVANIFAQRFELSTGRPDPGWPANGIPVCQTGAHAERPRIVGTSDGAFITWIDHRNNPGSPFQDRDVYLQYIKSATASWPPPPTNWQPDGISVAVFREPDQINPELDVDNMPSPDLLGGNTQGVVVTYQDTRRMAPGGPQLWSVMANHISSDGVQLYMPPFDLTVTGNAPGSQEYPRVVTTGKEPWVQDRRAVIVWQDHASNPMGNTPDIHAQAFDPWGNALFNPTGAVVCNAPGAQILPRLTLWEHIDPVTQSYIPYVTVGWEDGRDAAATGVDIYAGLLDAQGPGIMVNPQGTSGDPITQDPNDQDQLAMDNVIVNSSVNENTVFAWRHFTGTEWNIHYQEVNLPAWVYQQQLNGWPVTEAKGDQVQPQCARRVFVWQDGRRQSIPNDAQEDDNIYCQTPGECTGNTMMKWRDEWAMWTHGEDAANFRSVSDPSDGSTFVVWDEVRYGFGIPGPPCRIVFIQKFDRYGVPRWSNNGVAVNVFWAPDPWGSLTAQRADVCIDGAGGARVVWEQEVIAGHNCFAAHVTANGVATVIASMWGALGTDSREPRIIAVNNALRHSLIGFLSNRLTPFRAVEYCDWRLNNAILGPFLSDTTGLIGDRENLIVDWDGSQYFYFVTDVPSANSLQVGHFDLAPGPPQSAEISYLEFHGYDLAAGRTGGILGGAALLAYAIVPPPPQPAIADVYLGNYQLGALAINPITANGPDELSSHPAIDVDSIRVQGVAEEGALLVWNTQYQTGTSPIRHRVESNRFRYTGVPPAGVLEYPAHLLLDVGLTAPSSPDIARVINPFPNSSPLGVAVWEGGGEMSPCSPPRPTEIYGQFVIYDASLVNGGPQWAQPEMIGPGAGNYHQRGPMVKAAYPGEVSIFWLDSKNTENGILGTSLFDLGTSIRWIKRSTAEARHNARPAAIISSLWPQPSVGLESTIQLHCEGSAGSEASVELFDMLGRKVATLYSGEMREETLHVTFNPRRLGLGSGVYILRFSNAGTVASRNLHVTR